MTRLRQRATRNVLFTFFKYLLGICGIAWLVVQTDVAALQTVVFDLDLSTILLLVAMSVFGVLAMIYSWYALFITFRPVGFLDISDVVLVNYFVGQLVPSNVSALALMPLLTGIVTDVRTSVSTGVVAAHTALYAILYALVGGIGLLFVLPNLSISLRVVILLSVGMYAALAVMIVVFTYRYTMFSRLADRIIPSLLGLDKRFGDRFEGFGNETRASIEAIFRNEATVFRFAIAWAIGMMFVPAVRFYLIMGASTNATVSALLFPLYIVTSYSITVIPITPGGIGVAELNATFVFTALGFSAEVVVAAVLIDRFLGIYLPSLLGGIRSLSFDIELDGA